VGKHEAPDGAAPDPLVSEALAHRTDHAGGAHSEERELGWPAPPPPDGGGLGWPADPSTGQSRAGGSPAAVSSRRGWRRLFGRNHVA
jgi:hypothetical protein